MLRGPAARVNGTDRDGIPLTPQVNCHRLWRIALAHGDTAVKCERELLTSDAQAAVLEVLSRGALYGYELSQALAGHEGSPLPPDAGTLYPLLYNLEAQGLIRGKWHQPKGGPKRRYYIITPAGKQHLVH